MKHFFSISLFLLFSFALPLSANAQEAAGKRFDFSDSSKLKKLWQHKGKRFGVPQTKFTIVPCNAAGDKRVLEIKANRSTGFLATPIPESIWRKYPILRWRWRIIKKVSFPGKELDDQAAVVYFGDGTVVKNLLVNARDARDLSSIPGSRTSRGGRNGNPNQSSILAWKIPWTEKPGGPSPWMQRVRRD